MTWKLKYEASNGGSSICSDEKLVCLVFPVSWQQYVSGDENIGVV
jgi:hypothetical protein